MAPSTVDEGLTPIVTPEQPGTVELGTGVLAGATTPESWHREYGSVFARNVTVATLTPVLPDPAHATGTAVIVAPGGGFRSLSMENEGWDVARALADRGVAAFVLKYRLRQTAPELDDFATEIREMLSGPPPAHRKDPAGSFAGLDAQIADARAAFTWVRSHASRWGLDADRVGMVGFSAGAMLTLATALAGEDAEPAFLGSVYGPMSSFDVPADAPPLFIALAADDPLFASSGFGLVESWHAAGRPVEFHYYERGGHGFGMYPKETTSTGWFEAFISWMTMNGLLTRSAARE